MDHPRYGAYTEPQTAWPGVIDLERLESHPASHGPFVLDTQLGPGSTYRIRSTVCPALALTIEEQADAAFILDVLNTGVSQLHDGDTELAVKVQSRAQCAEATGALLAKTRTELAQLITETHTSTGGNHGAAGVHEQAKVNHLRAEIDTLERELRELVR